MADLFDKFDKILSYALIGGAIVGGIWIYNKFFKEKELTAGTVSTQNYTAWAEKNPDEYIKQLNEIAGRVTNQEMLSTELAYRINAGTSALPKSLTEPGYLSSAQTLQITTSPTNTTTNASKSLVIEPISSINSGLSNMTVTPIKTSSATITPTTTQTVRAVDLAVARETKGMTFNPRSGAYSYAT